MTTATVNYAEYLQLASGRSNTFTTHAKQDVTSPIENLALLQRYQFELRE